MLKTSSGKIQSCIARTDFKNKAFLLIVRESTNPRFRNPRFLFGVFFLYIRQKNRQNPQNKTPPLKKGGLVDSRVSTNPRFRNPRFLFGVFFLYLRQKNRQNPQNKTPPLKKRGVSGLSNCAYFKIRCYSARSDLKVGVLASLGFEKKYKKSTVCKLGALLRWAKSRDPNRD